MLEYHPRLNATIENYTEEEIIEIMALLLGYKDLLSSDDFTAEDGQKIIWSLNLATGKDDGKAILVAYMEDAITTTFRSKSKKRTID